MQWLNYCHMSHVIAKNTPVYTLTLRGDITNADVSQWPGHCLHTVRGPYDKNMLRESVGWISASLEYTYSHTEIQHR